MRRLAYPLLLAATVIAFFWKLWLTPEYTWLQAPDFANQLLPWYQFAASEWHALRPPLWTPYEWAGQSLIGQAQPGIADPLNLLLFAAPLNPNGWIRQSSLHAFYIAGYVLCAIAFYAFCRRGLLTSRPAAFLGAIAFALGGVPASTNWPQMMHANIWAPLGLLFQLKAVRENACWKHAAWSGAFFGVMWLSGHHQIPTYYTLASAGLWIFFLYTRGVTQPRLLRAALLCGLFLFAFGALQILPMMEYGRNAIRFVSSTDPAGWQDKVPYHVHREFSTRSLGLINVAVRMFEPYEPFMGVTALALALLGAWTFWRTCPAVRWLTALGVAAVAYALGANGFLQGVLYAWMPMIEKARVPAVALVLLNVSVAALAAYGVQALANSPVRLRVGAFTTLALIAVSSAVFFHPAFRIWSWIYAAAALFLVSLALVAPARIAPAVLAIAMLVELSNFVPANWQNQAKEKHDEFLENLGRHREIVEYVARMPGIHRINSPVNDLAFSFGDYWGVESIESFTASLNARLWNLDVFDGNLRDFVGVRYDIARQPFRATHIERHRFPASGLRLFENPAAFPRAWVVYQVTQAAGFEDVKIWMKTQGDDRLRKAVVESTPPKDLRPCATPAQIEWRERLPSSLSLRVTTACPAFLVISDVWDPGWSARVDGRSTKLWLTDGFVRGVEVPAGVHEVEMRYLPSSVLTGLATLAAGILGLGVLHLLDRKKVSCHA